MSTQRPRSKIGFKKNFGNEIKYTEQSCLVDFTSQKRASGRTFLITETLQSIRKAIGKMMKQETAQNHALSRGAPKS